MKRNLLNKLALWLRSKGFFAFSKNFCYNDYRKSERENDEDMENLVNVLPKHEADMIYDYIQQYAPKEGTTRDFAPLGELLQLWSDAKSEYLYKMFGGKLILEREIEYVSSEDELILHSGFEHNRDVNIFFDNFYRIARNDSRLSNEVLWGHMGERVRGYTCPYSYLADHRTLLANRWEGPEMRFPLPNDKNFKVGPGTKINRILGRLAKAYNIDGWDAVLKATAEANTTKITKGTLCLSIHPMDYMTMSDNNESWQSCMNWSKDGEGGGYRAGTVEMMNSPCVVVAYLKHKTNTFFGEWNSKIWRELYIVRPEVITNVKAYPFENEWLTKYIVSWLRELAETSLVGEYEPNIRRYASDYRDGDPWFEINKVSFHFSTEVMYNDCGRVDQYMAIRKDFCNNHSYYINYSGPRQCMCCGENNDDNKWLGFENKSSLICEDCETQELLYCDICGERIDRNDVYYIGDEVVCYGCHCEYAVYPYDDNSEAYHRNSCVPLYLMLPNGQLSDEHAWVYDVDWVAEKFFGVGATWADNVPLKGIQHYIPYENADEFFRSECGVSYSAQAKWEEYIVAKASGEEENAMKELKAMSKQGYFVGVDLSKNF